MEYTIADWYEKGELSLIDGHQVFHLSEGEGPHLVLIHGFPTSSWDWQKLWAELIQRYTVTTLDLLGFGYSDKPKKNEYTIHQQASIVEKLLVQKGIKSFHILAHDYGDTVAQELLARHQAHPIGILSCTLLNGGLFPETHRPRLIQRLLAGPFGSWVSRLLSYGKFTKSFSAVFGPNTQPSEAELKAFWELIILQDGQRIYHLLIRYMRERKEYRPRWVGALQQTQVAIALINGSVDPISGRHMIERYREIVSDHNIYELETIGHYPQTEAPKDVLRAFYAFQKSIL
ncbi:MAG: alpha/beta hydrolase [Cyclobacteriaceae bacterium]